MTIKRKNSQQNMQCPIPLRVHHLLCGVLFKGAGYSEEFVKNMSSIVAALEKEGATVLLKTGPDSICSACPNALADGKCALDDDKKEIADLDHRILQRLGIRSGLCYPAAELLKRMERSMTEAFFEECCGECRWYRQGLCSYPAYMTQIRRFTDSEM